MSFDEWGNPVADPDPIEPQTPMVPIVRPNQGPVETNSQFDTKLEERKHDRVDTLPANDFVVAVSASGKSAVSGTGKTTLATRIAKKMDSSPGGFDASEKATLNIQEFTEKVAKIPNKSAIVYDESQGTPGEGTGLDKRRGMKDETLDAINGILANRNKNLTIIIVAQHLPMLDKRVPMLLDAWVLIKHGPGHPKGPLATHHRVEVEDYNFSSPKIRTPAVEDLDWHDLPPGDDDYAVMETLKEKAKTNGDGDDTGPRELDKMSQAELAYHIKHSKDIPWRDVSDESERLTLSGDYLRRLSKELRD